ncbi:hypothetical protein H6P81_019544 [Aristolochia fimbriata]|uniref:Uncharacterized protein n=1 Tax=Aristolochia fimbriata TaxID=158543 RepID=A0AAV7DSW7_ARIFI|nr:hypothetical protein H6P81_019544 [Aristolochia fimbriata]
MESRPVMTRRHILIVSTVCLELSVRCRHRLDNIRTWIWRQIFAEPKTLAFSPEKEENEVIEHTIFKSYISKRRTEEVLLKSQECSRSIRQKQGVLLNSVQTCSAP